ncbi:hypothetical protein ACFQPA_08960 [Halomarina halobia]|uniref:Type IV pilin n=1 Tax=Halomarina halobia TaxID=3033386 RepID=A0ABD6ABI5_9EURY|nr:hypothetical protein [Halomarina sp. PSR21]
MSRSSGRRAQVEPVAALVALVALSLAVSLYAGVAVESVAPDADDGGTAATAADRAVALVAPAGVATPADLPAVTDAAPAGYRLNATLSAGGERWHLGPAAPSTAPHATRPVSVRLSPGRVVPGTLSVVVWP